MKTYHIPVLIEELVEFISPAPGMIIVDATIGGGGHAKAMLERMANKGLLIGIDQDPDAISYCQHLKESFGEMVVLFQERFSRLDRVLDKLGIDKVDAIYFDLGVSWHQLEEAERGFSFMRNGPLDMRMNPSEGEPAYSILSKLNVRELEQIFREYGEERYSHRVAKAIVELRRQGRRLKRTRELAELVERVVPRRGQRVHPATRIFQALRIYVNQELDELKKGLEKAYSRLKRGGRIAVISYHSLEDRIVKNSFREWAKGSGFKILTKKPIQPKQEEIKANPKARSAKLRCGEKIR